MIHPLISLHASVMSLVIDPVPHRSHFAFRNVDVLCGAILLRSPDRSEEASTDDYRTDHAFEYYGALLCAQC